MISERTVVQTGFFDNAVFHVHAIFNQKFDVCVIEFMDFGGILLSNQAELRVVTHHPAMSSGEKQKKLIEIAEAIIAITENNY
jgi:hypothetical protein